MYTNHSTHINAYMNNAAAMSGGSAVLGQPAPSTQGETTLIQLSHNIEQLEAEVQALISRVNPILRPAYNSPPVADGKDASAPAGCALANTFRSLSCTIETLRSQIGDAISRVDI